MAGLICRTPSRSILSSEAVSVAACGAGSRVIGATATGAYHRFSATVPFGEPMRTL